MYPVSVRQLVGISNLDPSSSNNVYKILGEDCGGYVDYGTDLLSICCF